MGLIHLLPAITRITTAVVGLVVMKQTYDLLSSDDFARFSLILFSIAVGSAIAAPINRFFWAHNSREVYAQSVLATWVIVFSVLLACNALNAFNYPAKVLTFPIISVAGCLYALSKVLERFTYGQILFEHNFARALLLPLAAALIELLVVSAMQMTKTSSLGLRFALPSVGFIAMMLVFSPTRVYLRTVLTQRKGAREEEGIVVREMRSTQGYSMIALTVLTTLAVMMDRMSLAYFPVRNAGFSADYLLVLSYAIAIQTLLSGSIDLARKHVYRNGDWVCGARVFTHRAFAFFTVTAIGAVAAFPGLQYFQFIPSSIDLALWAALVVRSITLLMLSFACLDYIQSGNVRKAFPPLLLMVSVVAGYLALLGNSESSTIAAIALMTMCVSVSLVLGVRFLNRMPVGENGYARA